MKERTKQEREIIRGMIAVPYEQPPATDKELDLFLAQADATGLDPLKRHCFGQLRKSKDGRVLSFLASIDGFRYVAERSDAYEGQDGPFWCGPDGVWHDVWLSDTLPSAAKVGVWRKGFRSPCWGVARWDAYAQTEYGGKSPTKMWAQFKDTMLAKCAEALALRKAFPNAFGGVYTKEEMDQADRAERKAEAIGHTQAAAHEAQEGLAELGLGEGDDAPAPEAFVAFVQAAGPGAEAMAKAIILEFGAGMTYRKLTGHDRAKVWSELKAWQDKGAPAPIAP